MRHGHVAIGGGALPATGDPDGLHWCNRAAPERQPQSLAPATQPARQLSSPDRSGAGPSASSRDRSASQVHRRIRAPGQDAPEFRIARTAHSVGRHYQRRQRGAPGWCAQPGATGRDRRTRGSHVTVEPPRAKPSRPFPSGSGPIAPKARLAGRTRPHACGPSKRRPRPRRASRQD